jgi:16S rRNA (guanine966-N2)-methyltransferase
LRPTSDRVKETLFNWLMQHTANAVCLDMFAGSAGLGIEALSRGAQHVVFVELDKTVILQIQKNIETLGESQHSSVVSGDALKLDLQAPLETLKLEGKLTQSTFDLVFIDPPFGHDLAPKALQNIIEQKLLAENAYVYIELGHDDELVIPPQFDVHKQIKTSQVHAHLLIYKP